MTCRRSSVNTAMNDGASITSTVVNDGASITPSFSTMSLPRTMSGGSFRRRSSTSTRQTADDAFNADWDNALSNGVGARTTSMKPHIDEKTSNVGTIPNSISLTPSSPVQQTNALVVTHVECKTEDGKTKLVPKYMAGMAVYYRQGGPSNDIVMISACIIDVHLDDLLEPYLYDIARGRKGEADRQCSHYAGAMIDI